MIECIHESVDGNICTDCGLLLKECEYFSHATKNESKNKKVNNLAWKYTIFDNENYMRTATTQILEHLNKLEYQDEIIYILKKKKFSNRMNIFDKIITVSFYVLKENNVPVITKDFTRISKKGAHYILLMLNRNFPYQKASDEYILALLSRIENYLYNQGYVIKEKEMLRDKIMKINKQESCYCLVDLILSLVFCNESCKDVFYLYNLDSLTNFLSFKNTFKKIWEHKSGNKDTRNSVVLKKVEKACQKIKNNIKSYDKKIDYIDLYLEEELLKGTDPSFFKEMTLKQLKTLINKVAHGL